MQEPSVIGQITPELVLQTLVQIVDAKPVSSMQ